MTDEVEDGELIDEIIETTVENPEVIDLAAQDEASKETAVEGGAVERGVLE